VKAVGYIILTFKFFKENNTWVGICEEFGTSAFGDNIDDVQVQLKELTLLHLNTLERVGERGRVFKENKIKLFHGKPQREAKLKSCPIYPDAYIRHHIQPVGA